MRRNYVLQEWTLSDLLAQDRFTAATGCATLQKFAHRSAMPLAVFYRLSSGTENADHTR
jgi:hypothetical protein